jgi:hypothetical protein
MLMGVWNTLYHSTSQSGVNGIESLLFIAGRSDLLAPFIAARKA